MNALKAEIAVKRKALQEDPVLAARPTKYLRRGELERLREERERKEKEEKEAKEREEREGQAREQEERRRASAAAKASSSRASTGSPFPDSARASASPVPESSFNISNEETIRRLRAKGQPIRLFGESDKERRLRLRALELIEEKGHERHGGQNDFKKALEDVENVERLMRDKKVQEEAKDKGKKKEGAGETVEVLDLELIKTDPDRLYPLIYYALKRALKEWEEWMDERPDSIKQATQGKLAAATQRQSAEYLKPLFKLLRSRSLPSDMLARVAEIVHYMQKRQYQKANDSYLRLSIGNAPWPIGVTMVGIHERSAREKISADQVAHVLNDEVSRKYIQSLKRLLTFSQTKYPPYDVTQLMG
ncbi:Prp18-domain-containing protein [Wolfiporia cocos MD-104 SS10]|uniref:Pre-mRNA-splicing factor 18 n=1 Tax=Wolfiporia cocos (strain MD-104) TaxID=742152 RepID=A0A2H3K0S8_WOLCO|nr:Prp18-domain-containing protein [Wolfiporia cocos MD-104 SS10]